MRNLGKWLTCCGLVCLGWFAAHLLPATGADPQPGKNVPQPGAPLVNKGDVLAIVNRQSITRQDLGEELIARFGKAQLELLINRRIIQQEAEKARITVTDQEVLDDLQEVMRLGQFRTLAEFEQHFLKKEKNCTLYEYKEDVVRPGLIMKKLAGQRLNVTEEEIARAFAFKYGDKVQCRIILESQKKIADSIYTDILRSDRGIVQGFILAAKRQSNPQLAPNAGWMPPIGHSGTPDIVEQKAFTMRDGEMSEVLVVPAGNLILLRENAVPPDDKHTLAKERDNLRLELLEKKMRAEVPKIFAELKKQADVQDFLNKKDTRSLVDVLQQNKN